MTMHEYRRYCIPGTQVCIGNDISRSGVVQKLSNHSCKALIAWDNGDVTWAMYYVINRIKTSGNE
jgi:hypothetical protein